jgi:hypothetical protein
MSRRSFFLAIGVVVLLFGGGLAGTVLLLRHEPRIYQNAAVPPGKFRQEASHAFTRELTKLISAINNEEGCVARFNDEEINSYFEEQFVQSGLDDRLLPEAIHQPRVVFSPDHIRLAFRYGQGMWSTIVSIDMHVWLAKNEPNVLVLELEDFRAGALPITSQSLLQKISETGQQNGIDVTWYRHTNGNPVALLRFQSSQKRSSLQLRALQLQQGQITFNLEGKEQNPDPDAEPAVALKP